MSNGSPLIIVRDRRDWSQLLGPVEWIVSGLVDMEVPGEDVLLVDAYLRDGSFGLAQGVLSKHHIDIAVFDWLKFSGEVLPEFDK